MSIENIIIPKFDMKDPDAGTKINSFLHDLVQEIREDRKLKVKNGTFACPGSTGNYIITGVGAKPRYMEFWWQDSNGIDVIMMGHGQVDSSETQNAIYWSSADDKQVGGGSSAHCIYHADINGAMRLSATLVSMNEDGCTINFTVVCNDYTIYWKAIA